MQLSVEFDGSGKHLVDRRRWSAAFDAETRCRDDDPSQAIESITMSDGLCPSTTNVRDSAADSSTAEASYVGYSR